MEKATLGAGCFWCIEAVMQRIQGVSNVKSGYAGGQVKNPTYRQVCSGQSGHAEVIQFDFDPKQISYKDLIFIFMHSHDPTSLYRQGADEGTQYRTIVLYHDLQQKQDCEEVIRELNEKNAFGKKIATEVKELDIFYPAEQEHQNFYNDNPSNGYCRAVIDPKITKFYKNFKQKANDVQQSQSDKNPGKNGCMIF